jgi:aryl-alcohol dehydrogenase (NADP+)
MEYVNLGRSGLKVSRLALGAFSFGDPAWRSWVLSAEDSRPIVKRALDAGINFFDTANSYSRGVSEQILGRALRDMARREDVVIATKVYFPTGPGPNNRGLSRKNILHAVESSLRNLETDYIDLYQTHRWDDETPYEEILETLHSLVQAGKVRYLGVSSMYAWQLAKAQYLAERHNWSRFVSVQGHYNLAYREEEREMMPLCREENLGVIPWSPLARGFLGGNRAATGEGITARARWDTFAHDSYVTPDGMEILARVQKLAAERGLRPAQIALAWLLNQKIITAPLLGATKLSHLEDALGALDVVISPEEMRFLEEPYVPHPVIGIHER